jgi:two-component system, NarL family, nitrate/nitrite response regulator NarL
VAKARVLLVDDNADIRASVGRLFQVHPAFEVVGEAEHGRDAIEKAPRLRPDLIVLDLSMPVMNGLEAAPRLIKVLPNVWIILLTAHEFPEIHRLLREKGIHAVVSKDQASTHLIPQAESLIYPVSRAVN